MSSLYKFIFYVLFLFTFLIGGFLQFFIGVPNVVITCCLTYLLLFFYLLYITVVQKIFINKVVVSLLFFTTTILISAVFNKTNILKVIIYLTFSILPLAIYLFFKVNKKNNYISHLRLSKLFLFIALIQYPIILLQGTFFDLIIPFSRSNQYIASVDFLFGSFFLKADHSLGFFILINILNLIENNKNYKITKYPILIYFYLGFTIFSSESNISKILLLVLITYLIYRLIPKKIKKIGFVLIILGSFICLPFVKKIKPIKHELEYMKREYNVKNSYSNYKRNIAKRQQIIIVFLSKVPIKFIGEGPYDYFNILKGKFKNNYHFSQLIWMYNDLGLIGLISFILSLLFIIMDLESSSFVKIILFSGLLLYSFMTIVFFDLAIVISLISVFIKKNEK